MSGEQRCGSSMRASCMPLFLRCSQLLLLPAACCFACQRTPSSLAATLTPLQHTYYSSSCRAAAEIKAAAPLDSTRASRRVCLLRLPHPPPFLPLTRSHGSVNEHAAGKVCACSTTVVPMASSAGLLELSWATRVKSFGFACSLSFILSPAFPMRSSCCLGS